MKVTNIIGIDISKLTLDAHDHLAGAHLQVTNDTKGFKQLHKWIRTNNGKTHAGVLLVMEFTGLYSYRLEQFLFSKNLSFTKRSPLDILRSSGIVRGKTDKADARVIARYGWQKREELVPMERQSDYHTRLHNLMTHRELLVTQAAAHKAALTELTHQLGDDMDGVIKESGEYVTSVLESQIKSIEKEISGLVASYHELAQNYLLLCSIKGIGFVTAIYALLYTQNFKRFDAARKFNSYCGIAPFAYGSGSSIHGRTKVSHLANKKMKSLMHQAAIIATVHDPELKAYFQRKKAEGKHKMSIYNAIRVKLVARMFAVIKRQTPYTENYPCAA